MVVLENRNGLSLGNTVILGLNLIHHQRCLGTYFLLLAKRPIPSQLALLCIHLHTLVLDLYFSFTSVVDSKLSDHPFDPRRLRSDRTVPVRAPSSLRSLCPPRPPPAAITGLDPASRRVAQTPRSPGSSISTKPHTLQRRRRRPHPQATAQSPGESAAACPAAAVSGSRRSLTAGRRPVEPRGLLLDATQFWLQREKPGTLSRAGARDRLTGLGADQISPPACRAGAHTTACSFCRR